MAISNYYAELTFNDDVMSQKMSQKVYQKLRDTMHIGEPLDKEIAGDVAHAMKEWAIENGATHFSHWFQPLRGGTAEKHDAFINYDDKGRIIERFSADQLIQSEPDASSFPSGGMRSTFEARGYTAWDPTSPAFLLEAAGTKTLVIPSVFLTWTGHAIDHKTPLLRSHMALETVAIKLQRLLGNRNAKRIIVNGGCEQEYFLIPKTICETRPDLKICKRTLFGATPAKGQQMEDHYFGAIRPAVMNFMEELDHELYRRGIPAKTRHNEVAPNQFEIACLYEEVNRAIDHNLQLMNIIDHVADRHGFTVILHEKPFAGVNGSGKHFNWSLSDNTGAHYLKPSGSPIKNLTFLITLAAILLGVKEYGVLLRTAVADAGNDHRLGAHEAPPAIMSVYLGEYLNRIIDEIENMGNVTEKEIAELSLGVRRLPAINRDASDRNRTSPIAFTGQKFEFRAVGSSHNCSEAATVLNLMVTYGYDHIYQRLARMKGNIKENVILVLKDVFEKTKNVRFEGNNYEETWHQEAETRGLPNLKDTPAALAVLTRPETIDLFEKYKVLNQTELQSKLEIKLEAYAKTKDIEFHVAIDMARTLILPALMDEIRATADTVSACKGAGLTVDAVGSRLKELNLLYGDIQTRIDTLKTALADSEKESDLVNRCRNLADVVTPSYEELRGAVDKSERVVRHALWPIARYQELLGS